MDVREEILTLRRQLEHANFLYYVKDAPEISDFEYDALLRRLEELEAAHPEYASPDSPTQHVGGYALNTFAQVHHQVPLESLQDVFSFDELRAFDDKYVGDSGSAIFRNICGVLGCTENEIHDIHPIKTGMTNLSFRFTCRGEKYVYRHPGVGTDAYINRRSEASSMEAARRLGLDDTYIYMDEAEGWKLSRYIEDARTLDYHDEQQVTQALAMLRRLHESGEQTAYPFDAWGEIQGFEESLRRFNRADFEDMQQMRDGIARLRAHLEADGTPVRLCHCDSYAPNFLLDRADKMYLIDRNGNAAGRFPVAFKGKCEQGISVYDYDNNRNYRIFVPCENREVYLYGLDGKPVEGWNPQKTDKPVVSKVQHFRVADKDYIVFADRYRFYILDRKGKERVRVSSVFDLKPHTDVYLTRKGGQPVLVFAGKGGQIHVVNFSGQTETSRVEGLSDRFEMNIVDWDGNGNGDVLFTDGNRVLVTRLDGTPLFEKKMEAKTLGFPYVYRFSAKDVRVGLTDPEQNQLFLLSADGKLSKGFPITGDSPFSIVFLENDGFFLFAGTGNNTILKYKVQR